MFDIKKILGKFFTSEDVAGSLSVLFSEVSFKKGDVIFKEGANSRELYLIVNGNVQILKQIPNGGMKILAVLGDGDVFGEGSLLSSRLRSASAVSVSDAVLYMLKYDDFEGLLRKEPAVAAELLMVLVRIVNQRLQYVNSELITLYEVTRILSGAGTDLRGTCAEVLKKLSNVTSSEESCVLLHNVATSKEDVFAVGEKSDADFISKITGISSDKVKMFLDSSSLRYEDEKGVILWLPVKNFQGKFLGMVVLGNKEGEFTGDQIKLAVAVTEQLGTAIDRYYKEEDDKEKQRLKQRIVSGL